MNHLYALIFRHCSRFADTNGLINLDKGNPQLNLDYTSRYLLEYIKNYIKDNPNNIPKEFFTSFITGNLPQGMLEVWDSMSVTDVAKPFSIVAKNFLSEYFGNLSIINQSNQQFYSALAQSVALKSYSKRGANAIQSITRKYESLYVFRIPRNASTTLYKSIMKAFIPQKATCTKLSDFSKSHFSLIENIDSYSGYITDNSITVNAYNFLPIITNSFNISHSHHAAHDFLKFNDKTYCVISLRRPIGRILSYYKFIGSNYYSSINEFIERAHPLVLFNQLSFLSPTGDIDEAKQALLKFDRILFFDEIHSWKSILQQDLNIQIPEEFMNKAAKNIDPAERDNLLKKIQANDLLWSLFTAENNLYDYAMNSFS